MFFIVVSFINLCVVLYVSVSLILPTNLKTITKSILFALLILISQKAWLGAISNDIIQSFTTSSFWFLFNGLSQVALFMCLGFALAIDVLAWILKRFGKKLPYRIPMILGLTGLVTVYGFYEAMKIPSVRHVTLLSDMLPADWKPVKIAVLSDVHISSTAPIEKKWLQEVVRKTNTLKSDMILITGDIIDNDVQTLSEQIHPLFELQAPDGVYMSFGNHEMFHDSDNWEVFFKQNNMTVLNDDIRSVRLGDNDITIAGIYRNNHLLDGIVSAEPILLLAHYPSVAKKIPSDLVFLQLSGHTHGGQFAVLAPLVAKMNQGFVKGLYSIGRSQLYVHSGTGLWRGFPFRFLTPPEITLMTIVKK